MSDWKKSTLQTWHSRVCGLLLWTAFDKKFLHTWNNTNMQEYNNNEWFSLGYHRNASKVFRGMMKIKTWGPDLSSVSIKQMLLLPLATKWRATIHLPSVFKTSILKCWKTGKCIFFAHSNLVSTWAQLLYWFFKGIFCSKISGHVVPNPYDSLSCVEHKRIFLWYYK